jgi:hypothetical protein
MLDYRLLVSSDGAHFPSFMPAVFPRTTCMVTSLPNCDEIAVRLKGP